MSYQLTTAKVWDGSAWVDAVGGGKAGQDLVIAYASDFLASSPLSQTGGGFPGAGPIVNVTANSSAHTFGAWTQLQASTAYEASAIAFFANVSASTEASASVIEIGVGAAGSETAIAQVAIGSHNEYTIIVPVRVAQGSRVSARLQSVVTGGKVAATYFSLIPQIGDFAGSASVDTYGVDLATSRGVNLAAGVGSNWPGGSWTEITSSTSRAYRGLVVVFSASNDTQLNSNMVAQLATGAAGSETVIATTRFRTTATEALLMDVGMLPFLYVGDVPQGSRLAVRQSANVTLVDACILGVPYL